MVEVVGGTQVERFAFFEAAISRVHRCRAFASGCGAPNRRPSWTMALVHVGREFGHRAGDLTAPVAVPAEEDGKAGDEIADFRDLEVRASAGAEGRNALGLQRGEVRAAVVLPHAVQQQGHLAVVRDDLVALQELDEIGEALGLVALVLAPDCDDAG